MDAVSEEFGHPRLAAVYDALWPDRSDLDAYAALVGEFGARRVVDLGCGTGVFALRLAALGLEVTGVDPAAASIDVARAKAGAEQMCWVCGDATAIPSGVAADLVTMTANAAQEIAEPADWDATLAAVCAALRPGGRFVFETRDPARRAWESWHHAETHRRVPLDGVGEVELWCEVLAVAEPLVTFRWTYVFAADGATLTSTSTLRFRTPAEVRASLAAHGLTLDEIRDAPDRPGREHVYVAHR